MKKLMSSMMPLLVTSLVLNAQTVSTPIVGFEKKTFPSGTTGHGVGFVKAATFQGTATSVTGDSLTVAGASFTSNQFAPVSGLPSYYIQITSGSQAGLVVDISGNSSTVLNVAAGDLANVSGAPSFVIRPHLKVSGLFEGNSDLVDYTDTVTIYNSDGTVSTLLRDSTSSTGWLDSTSFNASDSVIYPGQGFLLSTSGTGSFTSTGVVNPTQTIVPIYAGFVNLVSLSNPSNGKDIQNINLGANLIDYTDTVGLFSSDGSLDQNTSLIWAGATDGFLDATSFSAASGVSAGGTSAIIVNASSDTTWVQSSPLSP